MAWQQRLFDTFTDVQFTRLRDHTPDQGHGWTDCTFNAWRTDLTGTFAEVASGGAISINNTPLGRNQACQVELRSDDIHGVLSRARGESTVEGSEDQSATLCGYFARFEFVSEVLQLFRIDNGVRTQLGGDVSQTYSANMVLRIECIGTSIVLLLDGVIKITQTDATYENGKVGLYVPLGGDGQVDNLRGYHWAGQNLSRV